MISAKEAKKRVDDSFSLNDTLEKIEKEIIGTIESSGLSSVVQLNGSEFINKDKIIKCLEGFGYHARVEFGRLVISWSNPK